MTRIVDTSRSKFAKLDSFGIEQIGISDIFWKPKISLNSRVSIPHQYNECERTGRIDNFRVAAGLKKGRFKRLIFNDSDVHKLMEGVAYDIAVRENPWVSRKMEDFISLAGKAQAKDGYLYTFYIINRKKRWSNLASDHEIYTAGHMIQAAVAHHRSTGRNDYLEIAEKWTDCALAYFGPKKHRGACGHPEIEMALIELYRETGKKKYLELAEFFLNQRGRIPRLFNGDSNLQDHAPVREQNTVAGHAVRQLYLCCGEADLYAEKGDRTILRALKNQWDNFVNTKMYITGGAGSDYSRESFEEEYYLPNRAYAETCASIASFMWNWRMFLIEPDARYTDIMETVMYNGIISGMSLDGKGYFYANPLEHKGNRTYIVGSNKRTTKHWDGCACCPPNMARFLASVQGTIYAAAKENPELYVNFFIAGTSELLVSGIPVRITQETEYPWSGKVVIKVDPPFGAKFALKLRMPGWVKEAKVSVNGRPVTATPPGTYLSIFRNWKQGDKVHISLPMPIERIRSDERVTANAGCVALKRGPIVYCIEAADFGKNDIFNVALPENAKLSAEYKPGVLGGITVIKGKAVIKKNRKKLYSTGKEKYLKKISFTAIPYFSWANRKKGKMRVWIPESCMH